MIGFFEYLKSKGLTPKKGFLKKMQALTDDQLRELTVNAIGYASISHKVLLNPKFEAISTIFVETSKPTA